MTRAVGCVVKNVSPTPKRLRGIKMENNSEHRRYQINDWKQDNIKTWWAFIYIGGNFQTSEMICRKLCFPKGLCVTIEPVKYIFAGGTEDGVRIGMIQYPPFPEKEKALVEKAILVGKEIAEANYQWSFSIITPTENIYLSRRK